MNAYVLAVNRAAMAFLERNCVEERTNRGVCVDEIKRLYGDRAPLSEPWCAQFVYAMHRIAALRLGAPIVVPRTKGARVMLDLSRKAGIPITRYPKAGSIFARRSSGAPSGWHVGQCVNPSADGGFYSIEGNIDNRVASRYYTAKDLTSMDIHFIDVAALYNAYTVTRQRLEWY